MRIATALFTATLALGWVSSAIAGEWDSLPQRKVTTFKLYMHPKEAYKFVTENKDKVLFLDVRSKEEVEFLGMASVADANVPYLQNSDWFEWNDGAKNFKLVPNNNFAAEVERRLTEKHLTKDDPVVLMCRSGDRSAMAADLLAKLGYKKVYSVAEGYEGDFSDSSATARRTVNGWKNDGLPWSYQLDKNKMAGSKS